MGIKELHRKVVHSEVGVGGYQKHDVFRQMLSSQSDADRRFCTFQNRHFSARNLFQQINKDTSHRAGYMLFC